MKTKTKAVGKQKVIPRKKTKPAKPKFYLTKNFGKMKEFRRAAMIYNGYMLICVMDNVLGVFRSEYKPVGLFLDSEVKQAGLEETTKIRFRNGIREMNLDSYKVNEAFFNSLSPIIFNQ